MSTAGLDPDLHETERAGVPVFWAEAPDPVVAALLVRVGRADETLATAGLTHLVEHLALFDVGRRPYEYNGWAEVAMTLFYAAGSLDEVAGFLTEVAAGLRELPLERVDDEKRVLTTEALRSARGAEQHLLGARYGPVGYGLADAVELGLGWVGPQEVSAWCREWFTAGNAALWLTAEPPEGLELGLASGPMRPPQEPEPIPSLEMPCQLAEGSGGVGVSLVAARTAAFHAATHIAAERALARLRREAAVSYSPSALHTPLNGRVAHVVLHADCDDRDAVAVREELLHIVDDLAEHGPTEEELEWDRTMLERSMGDPEWSKVALDRTARNVLMGVPPFTRTGLLRERAELTPDGVASAIREAAESLIVLVPAGCPLSGRRRIAEYDSASRRRIEGRRHHVVPQWEQWGQQGEITVGPAGLRYGRTDGGLVLPIPFDECVAWIRLLSGAVIVVHRGGSSMTVYPDRYVDGHKIVRAVEQALGEEQMVPLTDRERELDPVVRSQLGERLGRVAGEVDALPGVLAGTEELRVLAEAQRGKQLGLVAVTDRRFLFLFGSAPSEVFEEPLAAVTAEVKGLVSKRLVLSHGGTVTEFKGIEPDGRIEEMVRSVARV